MLDWHHRAAESTCDWWGVAGVDSPVADQPFDWLGRRAVTARAAEQGSAEAAAPVQRAVHPALRPAEPDAATTPPDRGDVLADMPAAADAFVAWLRDRGGLPGTDGLGPRVPPILRPGARWMVITDHPQPEDEVAGHLFAGDAGVLLDAILRAIGVRRDDASLTSVLSTRTPSLRFDDAALETAVAAMLQRQVDIATPAVILLFGNLAARIGGAMAGCGEEHGLPVVNHPGGKSRVVMLPHLVMMVQRPLLKAEAWRRLRPLLKDEA